MEIKIDLKSFIKYLKSENINIDFDEFEFQIESHPDYPSLLSYSDSLFFFGISNYVAEIPFESIDLLPDKFMAFLKEEDSSAFLAFVNKKDDNYNYSVDGRKRIIDKNIFKDRWNGTFLLVEDSKEELLPKRTKNNLIEIIFITVSILLFLSYSMFNELMYSVNLLFVLSSFGLLFSIETFKQVLGIKSVISSGVCGFSSGTDCKSVVNSVKFKLFNKISLSDISIVFFSSQILTILFLTFSDEYVMLSSFIFFSTLLTVPISFFSIFYQWKIEEKWCPLCLVIIAILYLELLVCYFFTNSSFYSLLDVDIVFILLSHFISLILWRFVKHVLTSNRDLLKFKKESLRFRRNYSNFKNNLSAQSFINDINLDDAIVLGNPKSKFVISIVTNPHCGHCSSFHDQMEDILKKYGQLTRVNLRFSFSESVADENSKLLHHNLVAIYLREGGEEFMNALKSWFSNKDIDDWLKGFGKYQINSDSSKVLTSQIEWCKKNNVSFTPSIVIGNNMYPASYDRKDLEFFIKDLAEDPEFSLVI
ncbi:thioredoxin domain-containing protein [uncultured Aquimarina sp.]|uniref:thioredoxin domain-containing protein n=1 Tax=uncultured Aquimarina sp. TaxID=575652 RepID=UPI002634F5F8|nr:thioredoxin domain-containing protein [uncultured Aquimarina sp.]